jgi:hypothetical protein
MVSYEKDSAILTLRTTENGYMVEVTQWDVSPPPENGTFGNTNPAPTLRRDYIAVDKADLKLKLAAYVDNLFD